MEKCVVVTFDKDGTANFDAVGFQGRGCQLAIDDLAKGMGKKTDEGSKPELFRPAPVRHKTQAKEKVS